MSIYNEDQLNQYYDHVGLRGQQRHKIVPSTDLLSTILKLQLVRVPFECLSLHYSNTITVSLDPQDLFKKIVLHGRGGYCLENNAFFRGILISMGFDVMSVVCRISNASRQIFDGGWRGMSHMANIVSVQGQRFLIDVGYGVDGPTVPIPLISGQDGAAGTKGLPRGQMLQVEFKQLRQHSDTGQRVWVYSQQKKPAGQWSEVYHFVDAEMFPADFDILNYYNMYQSLFARQIVVQRFFLQQEDEPEEGEMIGSLLLVRDTLKSYVNGDETILKVLRSENERLAVLAEEFKIRLSDEQREAIHGRPSELRVSDD